MYAFGHYSLLVENAPLKKRSQEGRHLRPFPHVEPSGYQGLRAIGRLSLNPCRSVYRLAEDGQKETASGGLEPLFPASARSLILARPRASWAVTMPKLADRDRILTEGLSNRTTEVVYEAASHHRFSHEAYVVLEWPAPRTMLVGGWLRGLIKRAMAKPISQREAAKSHIDCAIRLLKTDDLEAHTLAYAAYGLLFELLGKGPTKDAVRKLEKKLKLGEIPNYFKHRYSNPSAILQEHSPETAHLAIAVAIRLWEEHGESQTEAMRQFSALPSPYEPGFRHAAALNLVQRGPITDVSVTNALTPPSTGWKLIK